ncbi:AmdA [Colletotrichum plurivorum]|uniref:AmdA n=1 Tax=Colletotrichum plurivorum TaxID=2175906 RepID=A0A8H6NIH3_9PEZI|nr:AmdA [Colletotrichum plurivorum]
MPVPRGRPRRHVEPCRFCRKQFKRQEHLDRHERTRTAFLLPVYRDLLTRHQRISHDGQVDDGAATPQDHGAEETARIVGNKTISTVYPGNFSFPENDSTLQLESDELHHALPGSSASDNVVTANVEPLQDSFTQNLMFGMNEMDFDFLWDNTQLFSPFVPDCSLGDSPVTPGSMLQQAILTGALNNLALSYPDSNATCPALSPSCPVPEAENRAPLRLPSMEPENTDAYPGAMTAGPENVVVAGQTHLIRPWKISAADYSAIPKGLSKYQGALPASFDLPSRHSLSRFLEGYFRGFHVHMPFLHCVTFSVSSVDAILVLSMAAVGALYRFERAKAYQLYEAARSMIRWRFEEETRSALDRLTSDSPQASSGSRENCDSRTSVQGHDASLQLLQAMVVVMAMSSWDDEDLVAEGLSMSSQVATLTRNLGIDEPEPKATHNTTWESWIAQEERRRTLYVAYTMLNLQSVAFDVPPLILNHELGMDLPSCASTWKAASSTEWSSLRDRYMPPESFRKKMDQLLTGQRIHDSPLSSFGNFVVAHGLLQHVSLARSVFFGRQGLGQEFVATMEAALRRWQESWEATYESTTDPSSPKGPMGFNSTAILRLAYVRLNTKTIPKRRILMQNPSDVVDVFARRSITGDSRSPALDRAVLQCIHALSIPVRVGIAFVARTQTLNWSIQHALCNIECAFLLAQWLLIISEAAESSGLESLRGDERRLVDMVKGLVEETELGESLEDAGQPAEEVKMLASLTLQLWAQTFKGSHALQIVHRVGKCLGLLADAAQT